jgi:hypothetical protein
MTDTFIHLVPIKDQSSGLFMMLLVMGGKTANNPFTIGRANVLFAGNLTQASADVQFSSVRICEFPAEAEFAVHPAESKLSKY